MPDQFRTYARPLAAAAIIFAFMAYGRFFSGPPLQTVLNAAVWVTFCCVLLVPRARWTKGLVIAATCVLVAETSAVWAIFRDAKLLYVAAVALLVVANRFFLAQSKLPPLPAFPAIAVMLAVSGLYIRFGQETLINLLSFAALATVLSLNLRNRIKRNELFEENKRHLAELQEAYERLQEASADSMRQAVLEERTRIAKDIHDAVGHSLNSLIVQIQALRYMVKENPDRAQETLEAMLGTARQGLQDIRVSVHALADDASFSGVSSLKALLSRMESTSGIRYSFHAELGDEEPAEGAYAVLFKVLQEAVTNVIRHSGATRLEVALSRGSGTTVLRIRDNGTLEPGGEIREGFGFRTMKARLEVLGGSLRYAAAAPNGLEIVAEIPDEGQPERQEDRKRG
ncbi:sensor histidine kinase [Cohnella caldifontis]|uniref:sensor histidine kinase n=1 Tax=Cohnella caldifontis TaxID=3027471 RepID=UPI0023EBC2B6|nr:sensor histidine kinase [Cohnella sp. YIM B05605]